MSAHKRIYFCSDCLLRDLGRPLTEVEWIQHLAMFPTHGCAIDENEEEEYKEVLNS